MNTILLIISLFTFSSSYSNNVSTQDAIKINGLSLFSSKDNIIKTLGKPKVVFAPHYDCGWDDYDDVVYYVLKYDSVNFIGHKTSNYVIKDINFSPFLKYKISYNGVNISSETSLKSFLKISGQSKHEILTRRNTPSSVLAIMNGPHQIIEVVHITDGKSDDSVYFYFVNDKLCRYEYFTPC
ncbi:hypothetical protein CLV32_4575 [Pedobacter duraquae]|uniref:Uncharacterized protein n=1 Tax=Pedobacter duraquae TaxID=425511 RepID=A0A4R6IEJ5_9SPHI|nr:hypothetical protein CLV32_4575 [Pedobacter duraquae]